MLENYYDSLDADHDGFDDESGSLLAYPDFYTRVIDVGPVDVSYQFDRGKVKPIRTGEEGEYIVAETETEYEPMEMIFYEAAVNNVEHGVLGYGAPFYVLIY